MHFVFAANIAESQFPNTKLGDQWRMSRLDTQLAVGAWQHNLDHTFAQ